MSKLEKRDMANEDTAKLSEEMSGLKAEFAKIAETVSDFVSQHGKEAAAKIQGTAEEGWNEAKKKIDCVNTKIHEEPVTAAAIALGIGIVLGLIFGRRR
jgi:ElaB/YqjD/DUF883 family membrane-anchored ribosome-binding protein